MVHPKEGNRNRHFTHITNIMGVIRDFCANAQTFKNILFFIHRPLSVIYFWLPLEACNWFIDNTSASNKFFFSNDTEVF